MAELNKPSRTEEEYFARQELERRRKWAAELAERMAAEEKRQAKELHWMKCPKCGMDLEEMSLFGVKVDQCSHCGGVFFDAGEIEQVLRAEDKSVAARLFSLFR